jgi:hypothetical protein
MIGFYEGLEEVSFKKTARGWVFQTVNPWLLGPRTHYSVTDAQKTEIAACVRGTLRRVNRFAIGYAVLMPFLFAFGFGFLMFSGATISITTKDDAGETTTTQSIYPTGATGVFATQPGMTATYSVGGPPGYGDKLTITGLDASGKVVWTSACDFVEGTTTTVVMKDATGRLVRTAILAGHADLAAGHIWLWATLLGIVLILPIVVLPHAYGYRRLRPLVAGLPRSEERITWREHVTSLAINASPKYLSLILISGSIGLIGSGMVFADRSLEGRPILEQPAFLFGVAGSMLTLALFGYLRMLRRKAISGALAG